MTQAHDVLSSLSSSIKFLSKMTLCLILITGPILCHALSVLNHV